MNFEVIVPIVTLILGFFAAVATEWFRESQRVKAELAARSSDFQRTTLLELQRALHDLARSVSAIYHEELVNHRKSGKWAAIPISDEWDQKNQEANMLTALLKVRVEDESVRTLVDKVRDAAAKSALAVSKEESESQYHHMMDRMDEANERIGELLRA